MSMAKRKENMLEAFQASASDGSEREAQGYPPEAAGPFAPVSRGPAPRIEPRAAPMRSRERLDPRPADLALAPVAMPFGSVTFLVLQILLLAGAFALGRLTAPQSSQAASLDPGTGSESALDPGAPAVASTPAGTAPAKEEEPQAEVDQHTEFDRAFEDPENRFTIQVVQYRDTEWQQSLAFSTYDFLFNRGLPVVKPVALGGNIFIYVGAARTQADLAQTLEIVHNTPGPQNSKDAFKSAWIVNKPKLPR